MNARSSLRRHLPEGLVARLRRLQWTILPHRWMLARWVASATAGAGQRWEPLTFRTVHLIWGNSGYSASPQMCMEVNRLAGEGTVVELGSGLTTLLLRTRGSAERRVVTLEHDREWGALMADVLPERGDHELRVVGLTAVSEGVEWYDTPIDDLLDVNVVVCDGPPAETRGGRSGVHHLLARRRGEVIVVIDDVDRADEAALVDDLVCAYGTSAPTIHSTGKKSFAVVTVPKPL